MEFKIDALGVKTPHGETRADTPSNTTKRVVNNTWGKSSITTAEDPYNLDLSVTKQRSSAHTLGPASHGCTVNATCENCVQTDNCGHSHYCETNNRCGNTDGCNG